MTSPSTVKPRCLSILERGHLCSQGSQQLVENPALQILLVIPVDLPSSSTLKRVTGT